MMPKKHFQTLIVAVLLACAPLAAKMGQDAADRTLSGRFVDAQDSVSLWVNDLGHVEGFYGRNGVFGEISGALVDGALVGEWMQTDGENACSVEKRGYAHWGRVEIALSGDDQIHARFGACNSSGLDPEPWTLERDKD